MCAAFFVKVEMDNETGEPEIGDTMTTFHESHDLTRSDVETESGLDEIASPSRKRKTMRSAVWDFFQKKDEKGAVQCQLCNVIVKGANTSNMLAHLKNYSVKGEKKHMESHKIAAEQCTTEIMKRKVMKETARFAHHLVTETAVVELPQSQLVSASVASVREIAEDFSPRKRKSTEETRNRHQWGLDKLPVPLLPAECQEDELNLALALYILAGMHPVLSVQNDQGLQTLLGILLKGAYKPPSWNSLIKEVDSIFSRLKAVVHQLVHEATSVAITTDIWNSPSNQGFLAVTGHLITGFSRSQCLLSCRRFANCRAGDKMADLVNESLNSYGIAAKVSGVVTDSSHFVYKGPSEWEVKRNLKISARGVSGEYSSLNRDNIPDTLSDPLTLDLVLDCAMEEDIVIEDIRIPLVCVPHAVDKPMFLRIKCAAQQLYLAVRESLQEPDILILLQCCRQLIYRMRSSTSIMNKLRQEFSARGIPGAEIPRGSVTRWNSTYTMLLRLLEAREVIEAVARMEKIDFLQHRHFVMIQGILLILKPFAQAIETISSHDSQGPYQSGISTVLPLIFILNKQLEMNSMRLPPEQAVRNMFQIIQKQVSIRFSSIPDVYCVATLLDPRYMDHPLTDYQKQVALDWIAANFGNPENGWPLSDCSLARHADAGDQFDDLWSVWDRTVAEAAESLRATHPGKVCWKAEFDMYIRENKINRRDDPLIWWRNRRDVYPLLAKVATKIIGLPGTSAAAERAYAEGREIMNHFRTSLTDDNFEKCVFVRMNFAILKNYVLNKKHKEILDRLNL